MHTDLLRVLIIDSESALLFSLSNYLTFRGCLVDCTERITEARALARHLAYDVAVVGVRADNLEQFDGLAEEIRRMRPQTRLVVIAPDGLAVDEQHVSTVAVDKVVRRDLSLDELAGIVCSAIAA